MHNPKGGTSVPQIFVKNTVLERRLDLLYERVSFNKMPKAGVAKAHLSAEIYDQSIYYCLYCTQCFFFFLSHEGCFIKVMTIIESEMGVVAGISFGVACFQVSPCG